jgi:hypothetical protein
MYRNIWFHYWQRVKDELLMGDTAARKHSLWTDMAITGTHCVGVIH